MPLRWYGSRLRSAASRICAASAASTASVSTRCSRASAGRRVQSSAMALSAAGEPITTASGQRVGPPAGRRPRGGEPVVGYARAVGQRLRGHDLHDEHDQASMENCADEPATERRERIAVARVRPACPSCAADRRAARQRATTSNATTFAGGDCGCRIAVDEAHARRARAFGAERVDGAVRRGVALAGPGGARRVARRIEDPVLAEVPRPAVHAVALDRQAARAAIACARCRPSSRSRPRPRRAAAAMSGGKSGQYRPRGLPHAATHARGRDDCDRLQRQRQLDARPSVRTTVSRPPRWPARAGRPRRAALDAVGRFPRELGLVAAEVAVRRGLAIDRAAAGRASG